MKKFLIQCKKCGIFHEGKNGFFASKVIPCHCGHVIDIKKEKIVVRECHHCGNTVLYDQTKGYMNICPVCKHSLYDKEELKNFNEFDCPNCACEIHVHKNTLVTDCPLCGEHIEVLKQLELKKIKEKDEPNVIKFEGEKDLVVWKHPIENFNLGSQLIVHDAQEAIFFKDGRALEAFGAGRHTLEVHKFPSLTDLSSLESQRSIHSEVYFVNMVTQTEVKWGTDSKVRMFDPASGLSLELGAYGEFAFKVVDSRKFLISLIHQPVTLILIFFQVQHLRIVY